MLRLGAQPSKTNLACVENDNQAKPGEYNGTMARGWESKGVEDQQAEAQERQSSRAKPRRSPEEIAKQKRLDDLKLSRSRILEQLQAAQNPSYRKSLEAALAELDHQLSSQNDPRV